MPQFRIRVVNPHFEYKDEGAYYPDVAGAYLEAIRAGIDIGAEEVLHGSQSVIVEICVEEMSGKVAARGSVAVSTASFFIG